MTDKEIEKALEFAVNRVWNVTESAEIIAYINRLKAENEKLQQQVVKFEEMKCMDDCTVCPYGSIISQNATDYVAIEKEQIRKDTAKEILQRVVNICKNEEDFQDGTVNKQLEPLHFGIANGCAYVRGEVEELAKEYGVEVDE